MSKYGKNKQGFAFIRRLQAKIQAMEYLNVLGIWTYETYLGYE